MPWNRNKDRWNTNLGSLIDLVMGRRGISSLIASIFSMKYETRSELRDCGLFEEKERVKVWIILGSRKANLLTKYNRIDPSSSGIWVCAMLQGLAFGAPPASILPLPRPITSPVVLSFPLLGHFTPACHWTTPSESLLNAYCMSHHHLLGSCP